MLVESEKRFPKTQARPEGILAKKVEKTDGMFSGRKIAGTIFS
jgi:hypothetical protein